MLLCITKSMNPNYSMIPYVVGKNPQQYLKSMLYQNKVCGFLLQVPLAPPIFL
jgi:hypothetical protein